MKTGRLKKRPQFLEITNKGNKAVTRSFVVFCRFGYLDDNPRYNSAHADVLYGLTVTKKLGNAIVRNRIKRRLRHMMMGMSPEFPDVFQGAGLVLIGRPSAADMDFTELCAELRKCLNWLRKQA